MPAAFILPHGIQHPPLKHEGQVQQRAGMLANIPAATSKPMLPSLHTGTQRLPSPPAATFRCRAGRLGGTGRKQQRSGRTCNLQEAHMGTGVA